MQLNGGVLNGAALNGASRRFGQQTTIIQLADGCRWRLRAVLNGVDISTRLTDVVTLDREEGAARLLRLSLIPEPGVLSLDDLTGKSMALYRQRLEGETVEAEQLRFTGVTMQPGINASTKMIALTATCDLQNRIEKMTQAEIDALLPGSLYAEAVFGEVESHWSYCQNRLTTLAGNLDSAPDGSLRFTPWQPANTAHFSFGPSEVLSGSLSIQPADASQLINKIEITVEYRYSRLRHREHQVSWMHPAENFCTWLPNSTELPTQSMLLSALDQGGWSVLGNPSMTTLPPSMANPCGFGGGWVNTFTEDPHLLSFAASLAQRTAQTFTELYTLTLTATGSISTFGERPSRERYSDEAEFDSRSWEDLPADSRPAEAVQDALGDWVIDKDEVGRRENTLQAALLREWVRVHASHRQTRVVFQTPIIDLVYDTTHTVQITALGTQAQGKVSRVQEVWDIGRGTELATIELAIYRGGQVVTDDELLPPSRPAFDLGAAPATSTTLATQIGGRVDSPPFDEALDGFSGNASAMAAGSESYPRRLQFSTPDIPAEHRDPAEATAIANYQVGLPTDLLLTEVV